jgi:(E)-4-hydroxy-3-methylbut-2-enyl-diphosphate synthase
MESYQGMICLERRKSRQVTVGNVKIGGNAPVSVQSMLNTPSYDIKAGVDQARRLKTAGCDIIRIAVPNMEAISLIGAIKSEVNIPLVADIHFDYKLALESAAAGIDKIRINPGNIGSDDRVKAVADECGRRGIPIRIGVNSGSVEKDILAKYGAPTAEAIVDSAMYHASLLEKFDFCDIVLSLKSSDTATTFNAYTLAAERCDYPLHVGVTEAGTLRSGIIKSSCAIGGLLLGGIGDTIRVSLTDDPCEEVRAGIDILRATGLRKGGVTIVSCPTCGRTRIDLIPLAKEAEKRLAGCSKDIKVAIMGCVVNGPGEAKEADIGIAGGDGCGVLIKKGEIIRKIDEDRLLDELISEIERM